MGADRRDVWLDPEVEFIELRPCWHLELPWNWYTQRLVADGRLDMGPFHRQPDGTVKYASAFIALEEFGGPRFWSCIMEQLHDAAMEQGLIHAWEMNVHLVAMWASDDRLHAAVYFAGSEPHELSRVPRRLIEFAKRAADADIEHTKWRTLPSDSRGPEPTTATQDDFRNLSPPGRWLKIPEQEGAVGDDVEALENAAIAQYGAKASNSLLQVTLLQTKNGGVGGIVEFKERGQMPHYIEVRRAVEAQTPSAFQSPRRTAVGPADETIQVDSDEITTARDLSDIFDPDPRNRGLWEDELATTLIRDEVADPAEARHRIEQTGFEAMGWYQPHHIWSEHTWGIYLHAERIIGLGKLLNNELAEHGEKSRALGLVLSLALVWRHELFHAEVEAAATWMEMTSRRPRHRRYIKSVYTKSRMTESCREEAFANHAAFEFVLEHLEPWKSQRLVRDASTVKNLVVQHLAVSPPGYRDWQMGEEPIAWRTFAAEIERGKRFVNPSLGLPPMEGLLRQGPPLILNSSSIPTYIVGHNSLSDILFGVPSRREARRMLRRHGYAPQSNRGKGSHELWSKPGLRRPFALPARDPLSIGVFQGLLNSLGMSKREYVHQRRQR